VVERFDVAEVVKGPSELWCRPVRPEGLDRLLVGAPRSGEIDTGLRHPEIRERPPERFVVAEGACEFDRLFRVDQCAIICSQPDRHKDELAKRRDSEHPVSIDTEFECAFEPRCSVTGPAAKHIEEP
jgi:hypothetical protein